MVLLNRQCGKTCKNQSGPMRVAGGREVPRLWQKVKRSKSHQGLGDHLGCWPSDHYSQQERYFTFGVHVFVCTGATKLTLRITFSLLKRKNNFKKVTHILQNAGRVQPSSGVELR